MALTRIPLKAKIKTSSLRLLSPLTYKSTEICTCTNTPVPKKAHRTKHFLKKQLKSESILQKNRVRHRSFRNQENIEKQIVSNKVNPKKHNNVSKSKSTNLATLEDHLQPKTYFESTVSSPCISFPALEAKNQTTNKFVDYLQNRISQQSSSSLPKTSVSPSLPFETVESITNKRILSRGVQDDETIKDYTGDTDYKNLNAVIDTINKNQEKYTFIGTQDKDRNIEYVMSIYNTVKKLKMGNPDFTAKKTKLNKRKAIKLTEAVDEIIRFFEDLKKKYNPNPPETKKYLLKEAKPSTSIKEIETKSKSLPTQYDMKIEPPSRREETKPNSIYEITPSLANSENIFNDNKEDSFLFEKTEAPYKSYSEMLSEFIESANKTNALTDEETFTADNFPVSFVNTMRKLQTSVKLSQPHAQFSVYSTNINSNSHRKPLSKRKLSTSSILSKDECKRPPRIACNKETKKEKKVEECKCVQPKNPECAPVIPEIPKYAPPLRRLEKVFIPEPPKVCPEPICDESDRADKNYKIKRKKLPLLRPSSCPCVEPFVPSINVPLKRLKPISIPKNPERVCIEETCPPRADDNLKIVSKSLPKLLPSQCPCIEPEIPTKSPNLPRLNLKVPEKPRVCEPCVPFCCPPRMDEGLKVVKKKLPTLQPSSCPCIEPDIPTKTPSLKRLGPINIPEPPKICPVEECKLSMDQVKVERKKLPRLIDADCPKPQPVVPVCAPPLKRLQKIDIPEPPKICPIETCEDVKRADDNYKIRRRKLPSMPPSSCPCVEPFVPTKHVLLKRLKPICLPPPPVKLCPIETCPPRADDNLKIIQKRLPPLQPSSCPCIEPEIPTKVPSLTRLNLTVPEKPRVCEPCVPFCCPPRMDDGLKVVKKKLPTLKPSTCPCIEPDIPTKTPSLKRLGPINISEPSKICPVEECKLSMDQGKVKRKKLPRLIDADCPKPQPVVPVCAPPLKRLQKIDIPEPPKICPIETCEDVKRADDNYKIGRRKLPSMPPSSCPCVEPFVPTKHVPLKRLKPICIPPPPVKLCPIETCPPRADDNLKIIQKRLPPLQPSSCRCIEPEIPTKAPTLSRLNLTVPEKPRVCEPCVPFCCPPRMDDGLKVAKKSLPRFHISDCPCVEPDVPTKSPSLKRLGPINLCEPQRICPEKICPPTMDQIVGFKIEKKKLQTLILKESNNTMSTKEYNERVKGKNHISKRKFGTRSRFVNFPSETCKQIHPHHRYTRSSFRNFSAKHCQCQPYFLSTIYWEENDSVPKTRRKVSKGSRGWYQKFYHNCKSKFKLPSFKTLKSKRLRNLREGKSLASLLNKNEKKQLAVNPSDVQVEIKSDQRNLPLNELSKSVPFGKRTTNNPEKMCVSYQCRKIDLSKTKYRRKTSRINNNKRKIAGSEQKTNMNVLSGEKEKAETIVPPALIEIQSIYRSVSNFSNLSFQSTCPLKINEEHEENEQTSNLPKFHQKRKVCKVPRSRTRSQTYLTSFKLRKRSNIGFQRIAKKESRPSINSNNINCHLTPGKCQDTENPPEEAVYQHFLHLMQNVAKYPVAEDSGEGTKLKAYFIMGILRKLQFSVQNLDINQDTLEEGPVLESKSIFNYDGRVEVLTP